MPTSTSHTGEKRGVDTGFTLGASKSVQGPPRWDPKEIPAVVTPPAGFARQANGAEAVAVEHDEGTAD